MPHWRSIEDCAITPHIHDAGEQEIPGPDSAVGQRADGSELMPVEGSARTGDTRVKCEV
jgi:hypothetical protein